MNGLDMLKVDLETPQPNNRKGESPRSAFAKYNELVDKLKSLGTAATKDVTTDATDTTSGRVLKVGDFGYGVGGKTNAPDATDDDLIDYVRKGAGLRGLEAFRHGTRSTAYTYRHGVNLTFGAGSAYALIATDYSGGSIRVTTGLNAEGDSTAIVQSLISDRNLRQTTGSSKDFPMSQRAVTDNFAGLSGGANANFTTMPQVSGSPIVESGSNANGNWVKWADGTMVCYHAGATGDTATTPKTIIFPQVFLGLPNIQLAQVDASYSSVVLPSSHGSSSGIEVVVIAGSSWTRVSSNRTYVILATGRWK